MQRNNTWWFTLVVLSLAVALAEAAWAQSTPTASQNPRSPAPSGSASMQPAEPRGKALEDQAATEADRSLNQRIRQALNADTGLAPSVQKVQLETTNGAVTLRGSVPTEKIKEEVSAKVRQVAGVKTVENHLQMAPN
jgi:hyperosmotically inducible protein